MSTKNTRSRRGGRAAMLSEDDDSDILSENGGSNKNESGSEYSSNENDDSDMVSDEYDDDDDEGEYSPSNRKGKRKLGKGGARGRGRGRGGGRGRGARGRGRARNESQLAQKDDEQQNSPEFQNKIQSDVIRYLLQAHSSNKLIKRKDLNDAIFEPNNCKQQASKYIDEARQILLANWGLNLKPCLNMNGSNTGMYHFILERNANDSPSDMKLKKLRRKLVNNDAPTYEHNGLIFLILGCIVLQGGKLRKDEFIKYIWEKIDCTAHAKTPEKLIQMLKQEKWILEHEDEMNKMEFYSCGPRTYIEFKWDDIYRCIFKLVNKRHCPNDDPGLQRTNQNFKNENPFNKDNLNNNNNNNNNNNRGSQNNKARGASGRGRGRGRASQRR